MVKRKEEKKLYYLKNREKILARNRERYNKLKSNPEFKAYRKRISKNYYYNNQETAISKVIAYNKAHRKQINAWKKQYAKTNPNFKITKNLQNRLYATVKEKYITPKLYELIGCSIGDLRNYLEAQFKPGMSWDSYGEWHIDHIKPCASFDLSDPEQQKQCFHYTNLQPLWANENRKKGKKFNKHVSKMQDYTIKVENDKTKYALELFFDNYKDGLKQFINNVLRNETGACDAEIIKKDGVFEVYNTAPDKGWVLGEYEGSLSLRPYSMVTIGHKYVTFDGEKLSLFMKEPEGASDLKVGSFLNLNHAVEELNSDDVKQATEAAIERRDAANKVEEDLARKSKLKALSENKTTTSED